MFLVWDAFAALKLRSGGPVPQVAELNSKLERNTIFTYRSRPPGYALLAAIRSSMAAR